MLQHFFFSTTSVDAAADGWPASHKSDRCISHHRHRESNRKTGLCNYSYRVNSLNSSGGKKTVRLSAIGCSTTCSVNFKKFIKKKINKKKSNKTDDAQVDVGRSRALKKKDLR